MTPCGRCGETDDAAFYPSVIKSGKQGWCRACHRAYYRQKVAEDREYFLKYQRKRQRNTADRLAALRSEAGCTRCGEKHPACLEFHHRDESTKAFSISLAGSRGKKTVEQMQAEIDKCDVLCCNCHRKLHYDERSGTYSGKRPTRGANRNGWDGKTTARKDWRYGNEMKTEQ